MNEVKFCEVKPKAQWAFDAVNP